MAFTSVVPVFHLGALEALLSEPLIQGPFDLLHQQE
jgi:hypothetical protein